MLVKKYLRVNSSHNSDSSGCLDIVSLLNSIVKRIKSGSATNQEVNLCAKLSNLLQSFLDNFKDVDELDRWIAEETIEMSKYTCERYDSSPTNDKI